jgi:hypothetical protein
VQPQGDTNDTDRHGVILRVWVHMRDVNAFNSLTSGFEPVRRAPRRLQERNSGKLNRNLRNYSTVSH